MFQLTSSAWSAVPCPCSVASVLHDGVNAVVDVPAPACCPAQPLPAVPEPVDAAEEAQLDSELQELRAKVQQVGYNLLCFGAACAY